jgi:Periplasmic binding protein
METPEPLPETNKEHPKPATHGRANLEAAFAAGVRRWASEHTSEIAWALLFAIVAGYAFAFYIEDPKPYKIYVVADPDTDAETLAKNFRSEEQKGRVAQIGRVPVEVQVEVLANQERETAKRKAEELIARPDTLLVIEHGRSDHVAHSLQTYLGARPQVPVIATVATDDELLAECDKSCVDQGWWDPVPQGTELFIPLLQLSPTNEIQGRSAVQFASQRHGRRRFMVVTSNNPSDKSYTENMTKAYSDAITEAKAELVGVRKMDALPTEDDIKTLRADCVLYAGGLGEAQALFDRLQSMKLPGAGLVVMLSDSVIESRGTDSDLAAFGPTLVVQPNPGLSRHGGLVDVAHRERLVPADAPKIPVNFTYQSDAGDYNSHSNAYAADAFSIAQQLIRNLNERGGDLRYWIKSILHLYNVNDFRRSLVKIMKQNATFRTAYDSGSSGRPYIFEGHKQSGGMFHVWRLTASGEAGSEMEDIDNWHPPRASH